MYWVSFMKQTVVKSCDFGDYGNGYDDDGGGGGDDDEEEEVDGEDYNEHEGCDDCGG